MKKRIAVLGATGSIGRSALDIISRDAENFETVLLSANIQKDELEQLKKRFPQAVCILNSRHGRECLLKAICDTKPDITINGISGAAGLYPSLAAINCGSCLALANKETVVMAGRLVFNLAKEKNTEIIPVDSEHSAIFHLIKNFLPETAASCSPLTEIILTASGGPFRKMPQEEMETVKAQDALSHPTWKMGPKITVDSASMANKGLEVIEVCAFFNVPPEKIKVVIHPQSIVHSMIKLSNGIIYAQLSLPDMRHPIHDAIYWPQIKPLDIETLNFDSLTLEFHKPDFKKFPMLSLAIEAVKLGGLYPCAYNAANEEAVASFLSGKIKFTDISRITSRIMERDLKLDYSDINEVIETDLQIRKIAIEYIKEL